MLQVSICSMNFSLNKNISLHNIFALMIWIKRCVPFNYSPVTILIDIIILNLLGSNNRSFPKPRETINYLITSPSSSAAEAKTRLPNIYHQPGKLINITCITKIMCVGNGLLAYWVYRVVRGGASHHTVGWTRERE